MRCRVQVRRRTRPSTKERKRRRKYEIEQAMEQYPVSLFMFEALYVDGKDLTLDAYPVRRKALENTLKASSRVKAAKHIVTSKAKELEAFFEEAIADGCEGLVGKAIGKDSVYQAGP